MRYLIIAVAVSCIAASPQKTFRRAAPPKSWDRFMESQFEKNAFATLEGERPANFDVGRKGQDDGPKPPDPVPGPGGNGDFDRRDMMKKLERSEQAIAEALSSEKSFKAGLSKVEQSADLVVMMGRTLFSNDPDYNSDDDYLKFSEDMTNFAKQLKVLAKKSDYAGASAVFGKMKTTCNACHEAYR